MKNIFQYFQASIIHPHRRTLHAYFPLVWTLKQNGKMIAHPHQLETKWTLDLALFGVESHKDYLKRYILQT